MLDDVASPVISVVMIAVADGAALYCALVAVSAGAVVDAFVPLLFVFVFVFVVVVVPFLDAAFDAFDRVARNVAFIASFALNCSDSVNSRVTSHTRTVLSADPEHRILPSALKANE
jgi:hypothetical protein